MSRRGVGRIPKPPRKHRIHSGELEDGSWFAFEEEVDAKGEDERRCMLLARLISKQNEIAHAWPRKVIKSLIRRIEQASTIASSVAMRRHRKRICGHLLRLFHKSDDVRLFTLLPANWVFPAGSLDEVDASKLLAALRQALRRRGSSQAEGWLFGFVDGEYEPTSQTFRIHMHGLVSGEMINVVKRLKDARNFRANYSPVQSFDTVRQPVRLEKITKTPIRAITYCMKSFWCQRPIFENADGQHKRQRAKHGISTLQPFAEHLLWLGRWRVQNLALVMGMSVGRSGFNVREKCT